MRDIKQTRWKRFVRLAFDFPPSCSFWPGVKFLSVPLHALGRGQRHGLALSAVLTECFSAAPKATDFMSDFKMHSLINMSASGDWQHSFWKRKQKSFYRNKEGGMNSPEEQDLEGVCWAPGVTAVCFTLQIDLFF